MSYTENLADFGNIERDEAGKLLQARLPDNFYNEGVRVAFNTSSGYVFLVNNDYQTAMFNGDELELFHSTPYNGHEGFISDLLDEFQPDDLHAEDADYIIYNAIAEGTDIPVTSAWYALYLVKKHSA